MAYDDIKPIFDFLEAFYAAHREISVRVSEAVTDITSQLGQTTRGELEVTSELTLKACSIVLLYFENTISSYVGNIADVEKLYNEFGSDARHALFELLKRDKFDPVEQGVKAKNYHGPTKEAREQKEYRRLLRPEVTLTIGALTEEEMKIYETSRKDIVSLIKSTLQRMQPV